MASDPSPSSPAGKPGRRKVRMGKYEVIQHIATGGMGAVYKARDTEKNRDVALKILPAETANDEKMIERFKREARSASRLHHDNIVHVYEFGDFKGTWFLSMEYVDGVDLYDYIKEHGVMDPEEARQIILQAARALRHANDQKIVHRDIKPSNILLTRRSNRFVVKLTDFGLAREADVNEFRVTKDGHTVGTIDYMAPEQARDSNSADIRSDIYSLGCTWYHLLSGHAPFHEGGLGERLIHIMNDDPPDVRTINEKVSDETWSVLRKVLAKDPDDRYPSPVELIDDLNELEGRSIALPPGSPKMPTRKPFKPTVTRKSKTSSAKKGAEDEKDETPLDNLATSMRVNLKYILIGVAVLVVAVVVAMVGMSEKPKPRKTGSETASAQSEQQENKQDSSDKRKDGTGIQPSDNGKQAAGPTTPRWPPLYTPAAPIDASALRNEVDAPWSGLPSPTDAFVARVSRMTGSRASFRSLAAACAAAPAGQAVVIEIHDNGPLFELPAALSGRDLTVRAGKGYRPLIIWDIPTNLEERRRLKKTDQPLVFLQVDGGRLTLDGIELAFRWPETLAEPATLLDVQDGELNVSDCTISVAGKPPAGMTLARFHGNKDKARCRLTRCYARGAGLTALDLDAPAAHVLLDGCLFVGGIQPMLRVRSTTGKVPNLSVVRSTLVCGRTLLELRPARKADANPPLSWLGWDSLLSRSSTGAGGEMLLLLEGADSAAVKWRAVNCLYAGWRDLLSGPTRIAGDDIAGWQRHWKRIDGDGVARDPWPEAAFNEPASLPAATYLPSNAVAFAASAAPDDLLGCALAGLPATRDGWLILALEPPLTPPEALADDSVPPIPQINDGKFHGARLDLTGRDLGDYLAKMQSSYGLGPRVVMHLMGKREAISSPIALKGSTLVLYFEEPEKNNEPLAIRLGNQSGAVPLIDVVNGNVEVIGGVLRTTDAATAHVSHLIRVKGGDIKLHRARLEGPQHSLPEGYRSAIALVGSGDPTPERMRSCTLNECVVLSSAGGILLEGVGSRLLVRQSVVVTGTEGLQLMPGPECKGRAGMQCLLENVTFACHSAVVRLGDSPLAGVPTEPVVVQARDCAYLNPFPGKSSRAGMLLVEGDALGRGLLLWQGRREGFDKRLYFSVASADATLPTAKEGHGPWARLWGSAGLAEPRPELANWLKEFDTRRWQLERLIVPMRDPPGANLRLLNIPPKKSGAG
jgi:serine/threonine-protein kinase